MGQLALRGDRLRQERESRGLSQQELSARTGIGKNQIGRYENGDNDPSPAHLKRIARELQVSTDYLLGLVDAKDEHLTEPDLTADERRFLAALRAGNLRTLLHLIDQAIPEDERIPQE